MTHDRHSLLRGESHAILAPLPVSGNRVFALGDNVAMPPGPLGTWRGLLFQHGRELVWLNLSGNLCVIGQARVLPGTSATEPQSSLCAVKWRADASRRLAPRVLQE
jgi:hypothetical protein